MLENYITINVVKSLHNKNNIHTLTIKEAKTVKKDILCKLIDKNINYNIILDFSKIMDISCGFIDEIFISLQDKYKNINISACNNSYILAQINSYLIGKDII